MAHHAEPVADQIFDSRFHHAVDLMDAGNEEGLRQFLKQYPELATERLYHPGEWLTNVIGDALNSFFKDPYLLWFVSEDAVRNKTLPSNIVNIASIIIETAKNGDAASFREQLDYALRLVAWSWVARQCGVQIALMDVLIDSGAKTDGISNDALVNGNFEAAAHLIKRGATITLPTALCLGQWREAEELASSANADQLQFSLVLAALHGKTEAVKKAIQWGADVNSPSRYLYSHGTPLHHAVWSGSMETVKILLDAGAGLYTKDTVYYGTPLGWAEYGGKKEIASYLSSLMKNAG